MDSYEINDDTLAIMPLGSDKAKIFEKDRTFVVDLKPIKIIDNSCKFFGSSYNGRFIGTKNLIGVTHKAPIIIEETKEIIFFPTRSTRIKECGWVSLKNLLHYKKDDSNKSNSIITFNDGSLLKLDISYGVLDNQVLRAARLESVLRLRKNTKNFI